MYRYALVALMLVLSVALPAQDAAAPKALRFADTLAAELQSRWSAQNAQTTPDPQIQEVVNQVEASNSTPDMDSIKDYMLALPVDEGVQRGYAEDHKAQPDLIDAREVIEEALTASLGAANVSLQTFDAGGYAGVNIVGVLPGQGKRAKQRYVLGAHYDSEQNPGADDDGSGVAGLLEAARVLGQHQFNATVVFVAFDQEEARDNGYAQGSQYYAKTAKKAKKTKVMAMLGLDMIAFHDRDTDALSLCRCDSKRKSPSTKLLASVMASFGAYTTLQVKSYKGEDASDPVSFFKVGIPALLVIEQLDTEGWPVNPYYHEQSDFYLDESGDPQQWEGEDYLDLEYSAQIVKGVVGWTSDKAGLLR